MFQIDTPTGFIGGFGDLLREKKRDDQTVSYSVFKV